MKRVRSIGREARASRQKSIARDDRDVGHLLDRVARDPSQDQSVLETVGRPDVARRFELQIAIADEHHL
jgi:hypothetical protein